MLTTLTKNNWHHKNSYIQISIQYTSIQQQPHFSDTLILVAEWCCCSQAFVDFSPFNEISHRLIFCRRSNNFHVEEPDIPSQNYCKIKTMKGQRGQQIGHNTELTNCSTYSVSLEQERFQPLNMTRPGKSLWDKCDHSQLCASSKCDDYTQRCDTIVSGIAGSK